MPAKSTWFEPKAPAGLVINELDDAWSHSKRPAGAPSAGRSKSGLMSELGAAAATLRGLSVAASIERVAAGAPRNGVRVVHREAAPHQ